MPIKSKAIKPMNTSETQTIYTLDVPDFTNPLRYDLKASG